MPQMTSLKRYKCLGRESSPFGDSSWARQNGGENIGRRGRPRSRIIIVANLSRSLSWPTKRCLELHAP
ncbi:unnamed protein product [Oikopleura dioica]|uniref:Uncharacterized protein n=1 Tax=Oikopleura dioica TaxID=34765 RepID=E4WQE7_OIKDI|nr:unnamed protein product [Oikopleura dioica]CBY34864.1 unnamed protein product [Oikopleura dioica]